MFDAFRLKSIRKLLKNIWIEIFTKILVQLDHVVEFLFVYLFLLYVWIYLTGLKIHENLEFVVLELVVGSSEQDIRKDRNNLIQL